MSVVLILALAVAVPQTGSTPQRTAKDAADAFTITSLGSPDAEPASDDETRAAAAPPTASSEAPLDATDPAVKPGVPATTGWLDVPIASLIANPTTKRVIDRDLPGLSSDSNLPKFQSLSLRKFQPLTGGQLTDTMLAKVAKDLDVAPPPPPRAARTGNRRGER